MFEHSSRPGLNQRRRLSSRRNKSFTTEDAELTENTVTSLSPLVPRPLVPALAPQPLLPLGSGNDG
jgi:hypothetical protein